jgi:Immunoglobulin-like domain of bacterial spore germination
LRWHPFPAAAPDATIPRMRRHRIFTTAVLGLLLLALPASASAAVTATKVRVGNHRGLVRVVVDFTGGTISANNVELAAGNIDGSGRARLELTLPGARTTAPTTRAHGVRVVVTKTAAGLRVRIISVRHRFKLLGYRALRSPTRLVIDVYRRSSRARLGVGGCVRVSARSTSTSGMVRARGTVGRIFEATFRVQLRRSTGRLVAARTVTHQPGRWSTLLHHTVARRQPGLLEAFVLSAKDGAVQCLSQRPITLMP